MNSLRPFTSLPALIVLLVVGMSIGLQSEASRYVVTETATPVLATPFVETLLVIASLTPTETETATPSATETPEPSMTPTWTPVPAVSRTATATRGPTTRSPASTAVSVSRTPARAVRVPILMYHYVSVPPPNADKIRLDLSVTPDAFKAQVDYLANAGYHPIRLSDLERFFLKDTPLPEKPIVLTFDDGYADNYANAFPILKARGFPGTFFVVTDWIQSNRWGYMNWAQLGEMAKAGMEIGSHALDHPEMRGKPRSYQDKELVGSKKAIESNLEVTVTAFSYPSGRFDANTLAALRAAGYSSAVTEVSGTLQTADKMLELRRIRVRGSYSVENLAYWIKYFSENGR